MDDEVGTRSKTTRRRARAVAVVVTALAGCGADDPEMLGYATQYLELTAHAPVCEGTRRMLDAEVERISGELGLSTPEALSLHFGHDVEDDCQFVGVTGCAGGLRADAHGSTTLWAAPHELVHMIRRWHGITGPDVFEEGIATILGGGPISPASAHLPASARVLGPTAFLANPSHAFLDDHDGTSTGAHFLGWLRDDHGAEAVVQWLSSPAYMRSESADEQADVFAEAFGIPLTGAEATWRASAAADYAFGTPCPPGVAELDAHALATSGRLDCELPDTLGPHGEDERISGPPLCFSLPARSTVEIVLEGPEGFGLSIEHAFAGCDHGTDDDGGRAAIEWGTTQRHVLAGCTWIVRPQADVDTVGSYAVSVRRIDP